MSSWFSIRAPNRVFLRVSSIGVSLLAALTVITAPIPASATNSSQRAKTAAEQRAKPQPQPPPEGPKIPTKSGGVDLELNGRPKAEVTIVPSSSAVLPVLLTNVGRQANGPSEPIRVSFPAMPAGLSFVRLTPEFRPGQAGSTGWQCGPAGPRPTCDYLTVDASGATQPAILASATAANSLAVLAADSSVSVGAKLTTVMQVSVPGDTNAANDKLRVSVNVKKDRDASRDAFVNQAGSSEVNPGLAGTTSYTVTNMGAAAFGADGVAPPPGFSGALSLRGLLPEGLTDSWSTQGSSWACSTPTQGPIPMCNFTGATLQLGDSTPPITVTYTVAQDAFARLKHKAKSFRKMWDTTANTWQNVPQAGNSFTPLETKSQSMLGVAPKSPADLRIQGQLDGGEFMLAPSAETKLNLSITNVATSTTDPIDLAVTMPTGVAFGSLVSSDIPWDCSSSKGVVHCKSGAGQALGNGTTSKLALRFTLPKEIKSGSAEFVISADTKDETAGTAKNGGNKDKVAHVPIEVLDPEAGQLQLGFSRLAPPIKDVPITSDSFIAWRDGARAPLVVGTPWAFEVAVSNIGNGDMKAPDGFEIAAQLPAGVEFDSASTVPADAHQQWTCPPGQSLTVTCTLNSPVLVHANELPHLRLKVIPVGTAGKKNGEADIAVSARPIGGDAKLKVSQPVAVKVTHDVPDLLSTIQIPEALRATGTGQVSVAVSNAGTAPATPPILVQLPIPKGVTYQHDNSDANWQCENKTSYLSCVSFAPIAPGAKLPYLILAASASAASQGQKVTISSRAFGVGDEELGNSYFSIPATIQQPLGAKAGADQTVTEYPPGPTTADSPRTSVVLAGATTGSDSTPVTYQWHQLCTTQSEVDNNKSICTKVDPAVIWQDLPPGANEPNATNAEFIVPPISNKTTFVLAFTATEGSTSVQSVTHVKVIDTRAIYDKTQRQQGKRAAVTGSGGGAGRGRMLILDRNKHNKHGSQGTLTADESYSPPRGTLIQTQVNASLFASSPVILAQPCTQVVLNGASRGQGLITSEWKQLAGPRVDAVSTTAEGTPQLTFRAPEKGHNLKFSLTATSANGVASHTVKVLVSGSNSACGTKGAKGGPQLTSEGPSGKVPPAEQVKTIATSGEAGPGSGISATIEVRDNFAVPVRREAGINGVGTGSGSLKYKWTQTSGPGVLENANTDSANLTFETPPDPTSLQFQFVVTDSTGASASATTSVKVHTNTDKDLFCQARDFATNNPDEIYSLGYVEAQLTTVKDVGPDDCLAPESRVEFSASKFWLYGRIALTNVSGRLDVDGFNLTSGTLSAPEGWDFKPFEISERTVGYGLLIPFGDLHIFNAQGLLKSPDIPFLSNLPGFTNWNTELQFANQSGAQQLAFNSTAQGPLDTSLRIVGSLATNLSFKLQAIAKIPISDSTLVLTGTISGAPFPIEYNIVGSITNPLTLAPTPKTTLNTFNAKLDRTGVNGTGQLELDAGASPLKLNIDGNFVNKKNWKLNLNSADSDWKPTSLFTFPPTTFSGFVKNVDDVRTFSIATNLAGPINTIPLLSFDHVKAELTNACTPEANKASGSPSPSTATHEPTPTPTESGEPSATPSGTSKADCTPGELRAIVTAPGNFVPPVGGSSPFTSSGKINLTTSTYNFETTMKDVQIGISDLGFKVPAATLTVKSGKEGTAVRLDFSDASFNLGGVLSGRNLTGAVTSTGVELLTGSISPPSIWGVPDLNIVPTPKEPEPASPSPGESPSRSPPASPTSEASPETTTTLEATSSTTTTKPLPDLNKLGGLTIPFSGGSLGPITGKIASNGFVFLPLPSDFTAKTTLNLFGDNSGQQVFDIAASAAKDDATATLTGRIATDGTFTTTATAKNLIKIFDNSIDVTGNASRTTVGAPVDYSLTGSLSKPVNVTDQIELTSLSATWGKSGKALDAQVTVKAGANPIKINVNGFYVDFQNWSLAASPATSPGGSTQAWEALPGVSFNPSIFEGFIGRVQGDTAAQFTASIPPNLDLVPSVHLDRATATVFYGCPGARLPTRTETLPANPTDTSTTSTTSTTTTTTTTTLPVPTKCDKKSFAFDIDLAGEITTSNPPNPFSGSASVDTKTGKIALHAKIGNISIGPLSLESPEFRLAYDHSLGLESLNISASATVHLSAPIDLTLRNVGLNYTQRGIMVKMQVPGDWKPVGGADVATPYFLYSNFGATYAEFRDTFPDLPHTNGATTPPSPSASPTETSSTTTTAPKQTEAQAAAIDAAQNIEPNTLTLSGQFPVPNWFKDMVGNQSLTNLYISGKINLDTKTFELNAKLTFDDDVYLINTSSFSLRMTEAAFGIQVSPNSTGVWIGGTVLLHLPGGGSAGSTDLYLTFRLGFLRSGQEITLTGSLSLASPDGWKDAFGISGLNIYNLAIEFSATKRIDRLFAPPSVTFGFAGEVSLPNEFASYLGIQPDTRISFAARFGNEPPCYKITIGQPTVPGQAAPPLAISIGSGAFTATYANLVVAPLGCSIGDVKIPAGFQLDFDGAILGVGVHVHVALTPQPFRLHGLIDIGAFSVGGVSMDRTIIEVCIGAFSVTRDEKTGTATCAPASTNIVYVHLEAGITISDTKIQVKGDFEFGEDVRKIALKAHIENLNLFALNIKNADVDFAFASVGDKPPDVHLDIKADFSLLGADQHVELLINYSDGVLQRLYANINASIDIGVINLDGEFKIDYTRGEIAKTRVDIDATLYVIGGISLTVKGVIADNYASLDGHLDTPFATADVKGLVYYGQPAPDQKAFDKQGKEVPATLGDFYLSAKNIGISAGPFPLMTGNLTVGRADKILTTKDGKIEYKSGGGVYGSLYAGINVLSTKVSISGEFDTERSYFKLEGHASIGLLGGTLDGNFNFEYNDGDVKLSADLSRTFLGNTLKVAGEFERTKGETLYTLSGGVDDFNIAGFTLGKATFILTNKDRPRFEALIDMNLAGVVKVKGHLVITSHGFWLSAEGSIDAYIATVNVSVVFSNCPDSGCNESVPIYLKIGGKMEFDIGIATAVFWVNGFFDSTGNYLIDTGAKIDVDTGLLGIDVGVFSAKAGVRFKFGIGLTLSSGTPKFRASAEGELTIYYEVCELKLACQSGDLFSLKLGFIFEYRPPVNIEAWVSIKLPIVPEVTLRI